MKTELMRTLKSLLYWIILAVGLCCRLVLAWLDHVHRGAAFWYISSNFWSKMGSVTMGLLILLVLIHRFTVDKESGARPVIVSTVHGRRTLFQNRLLAGIAATALGIVLLAVGNIVITLLIGYRTASSPEWIGTFLWASGISMLGGILFFVFSACVCDIMQNHASAMCLCGVIFGVSYILNSSAIHRFESWWFLLYGTFTQLVRGKVITDLPAFWIIWYTVVLTGIYILTIQKRKGRKEL